MSSPTGQGKCEKGNVARIVDRLSKQDFGTLTRTENVPLKANRAGVGSAAVVGGSGNCVGMPLTENVSTSDDASDFASETTNDRPNGPKQPRECAVVRFSYAAQQPDELDLKEGDELTVLELAEDGWARGCISHSASNPQAKGRSGLYPTNFVSTVSPTPTTQTAPVAAHPPIPSHCKSEDKQQPAEHIPSVGVSFPNSAPPAKTSALSLTNGAGIVQSANVLPSSLLKRDAAPTVSAGVRRAMSTLITPTTTTMVLESGEAPNSQKAKEFAKVLYNYEAANSDELSLSEGTVVTVVSRHCEEEDWFIAEHDGRRGLFPDNFVRFLDHGQMQASTNAQPPSLPAKPSKFSAIANPSTNALQNAVVPPVNSRNSFNALIKGPAENAKGTATEMHQSMVVERANQIVVQKPLLANSATDSLKANAANRRSVIEGLQKQLFPNGKLPPVRPPQPNLGAARPTIGTMGVEANTEPKLQREGEMPAKLLVSSSSIVKSRTNIAPSNKRPPSKVNSAATLAEAVNNPSEFDPQNVLSSVSVSSKPSQSQVATPSDDLSDTSVVAPSDVTSPTVSVCPVAMVSSAAPTIKTTVFPTRPSSPLLQATPILCSVSDDRQQQPQQRSLSSCSPTHFGNKQSPHLPPDEQPNFVSRAEFEQYKEEQERKLAALQDELKELRDKMMSSGKE
ncbi:hypothetical protein niasHT_009225 [Heterodera trifolii]|uniref:SH3 domain-containing protein n=1 Tax=Heterodera trifolii TaxID=157864 RepID=A0ABD2MAX8_9BILA